MIQINLLGLPKPKKGKRAAAASVSGDGPNPAIVIMLAFLLAAGGLFGWYMKIGAEKKRIEKDMLAAQKESQELALAKSKYDEREAQRKIFEQRVKVIEDLRAKASGPVELLAMIGDTINGTEGVWLSTLKEDGRNINIDGSALSVHQVASLMKNLQSTGYFRTVELKETQQDPQVKDMQQFNFTLVCEKIDKSQPQTAAGAAPAEKKL
ncbi:MAG: PilN domain-containing protein [Candidatus Koribacter versatilis]|uniref:PilN domain-containing protein n=1 Tax=Candidatus Korobacter versatilis TaxID=658062 RepID=A0A932A8J7_9BACT|nr:PilN domain-containing protein [Candidatus Koribacter versatilis]